MFRQLIIIIYNSFGSCVFFVVLLYLFFHFNRVKKHTWGCARTRHSRACVLYEFIKYSDGMCFIVYKAIVTKSSIQIDRTNPYICNLIVINEKRKLNGK